MSTRFLKTESGTFRVTINDDIEIDMNTRKKAIIGKLISVGGKNTCVFINAPNLKNTAVLLNVKTRDGCCEIFDKIISGRHTVTMINLAFTIVKEICPHIKFIELEDMSSFKCDLGEGKTCQISLAIYELAFHQSTWYERHFGAYLRVATGQNIYMKSKEGFNKQKPEIFSFNNNQLDILLTPIYKNTNTWKEFFDEIYKMEKRCKIMFPWYKNAVSLAMDGILYDTQQRIIDLSKITVITYNPVKIGGRMNLMEHDGSPDSFDYEKQDTYNIRYSKSDFTKNTKN